MAEFLASQASQVLNGMNLVLPLTLVNNFNAHILNLPLFNLFRPYAHMIVHTFYLDCLVITTYSL